MSKTHFEEFKDLIQLARDTLNRIKAISKEKSKGWENPLGFLALVLLFCSILQGLAIEVGADITQAFLERFSNQTMEKMRGKEFTYVG